MNRKILPLLGVFALLAIYSSAQNHPAQNVSGPSVGTRLTNLEAELNGLLETDDDSSDGSMRARVVEKTSGVKASVIASTESVGHTAFDLINRKRADSGLTQLVWSDDLARVASMHSQNMAEFSFFSHRGLDNKMVSDRADENGVKGWRSIGENIAFNRGFQDPVAKAVDLWLDSPSHRRNMLDANWKESAVGVAIAEDGSYYFTQVFLKK